MPCQAGTAALLVWTTLAIATPAAADVVADWNVCAPTIIAAGRATFQFGAGPGTQLDLAVVHLAMHDAIQAYDQRYQQYGEPFTAGGDLRSRPRPEPLTPCSSRSSPPSWPRSTRAMPLR